MFENSRAARRRIGTVLLFAAIVWPAMLFAQEWQPVSGRENLAMLFTDTVMEASLTSKVKATARYNADGSGELSAWDDVFPREWKVESDNEACLLIDNAFRCFTIERNMQNAEQFRATRVDTGETVIFTVRDQVVDVTGTQPGNAGGASQPSADEVAKKLANPANPVMTIGNNFDYVTFDGDLPDASQQSSFRYVFQTVFPLKLSNGTFFFRPAIPVMFDEPVPDGMGGYSGIGTDIADIGYDLSYAATTASGLIWGAGVAGTMPTASDDRLGKDRWALGPELLLGVLRDWGAVGGVVSHQWDFAGSGDAEIDLTAINYFYAIFLRDGWQIAAGPSITYDHTRKDNNWTIPLGIGLSKTAILAGRPWKFQFQYWNYVEAPDAFAPRHQFRLSINPVVSAPWNKGR